MSSRLFLAIAAMKKMKKKMNEAGCSYICICICLAITGNTEGRKEDEHGLNKI